MTLVDGYYGTTADTFEFISRRTTFRRGTGLPGMAWELGTAGRSSRTSASRRASCAPTAPSRSASTAASPCRARCRATRAYVLAFLSALGTPIARRFEIWKPDAKREHLHLEGGFCEQGGRIVPAPPPPRARPRAGNDRPGARDRRPGAQRRTPAPSRTAGAPRRPSSDSSRSLVMPIVERGRLVAAAAWYF